MARNVRSPLNFPHTYQISVYNLARLAGLIVTNSIRMVGNRPVLERILDSGGIFMAWSDRPWILDGAAVRVSIVGFDDGSQKERVLDGMSVPAIHADLTASADVVSALPLPENAGLCFLGIMKGGRSMLRQGRRARFSPPRSTRMGGQTRTLGSED